MWSGLYRFKLLKVVATDRKLLCVVSVVPLVSSSFNSVSVVSESFMLLKSSRLFSLFQVVLDSVRLLTFLRVSSVVHVV